MALLKKIRELLRKKIDLHNLIFQIKELKPHVAENLVQVQKFTSRGGTLSPKCSNFPPELCQIKIYLVYSLEAHLRSDHDSIHCFKSQEMVCARQYQSLLEPLRFTISFQNLQHSTS